MPFSTLYTHAPVSTCCRVAEEALEFCATHHWFYAEVSALSGLHVKEVFLRVSQLLDPSLASTFFSIWAQIAHCLSQVGHSIRKAPNATSPIIAVDLVVLANLKRSLLIRRDYPCLNLL